MNLLQQFLRRLVVQQRLPPSHVVPSCVEPTDFPVEIPAGLLQVLDSAALAAGASDDT